MPHSAEMSLADLEVELAKIRLQRAELHQRLQLADYSQDDASGTRTKISELQKVEREYMNRIDRVKNGSFVRFIVCD